jgi:NAD(P)-dependent dehydrogenase (short-subunit alcohol dehydrogenase family)
VYLARCGHDVVVGYREDQASAAAVVAAVEAAGGSALAVAGDVTDEDDMARLFEAAASLGAVTGLVNNAGLTASIGDLADTPVDVLRAVVEVNLVGALLGARSAVRVLSTARGGLGGAIVNVSPAAATLGSPHEYVHYAAAKAGVEAMTVGLAKESPTKASGSTRSRRAPCAPASTPPPATPTVPTGSPAASPWAGPGNRLRSPRPSPGCSARRAAT